jgi:hypothetical protein
LKPQAYRLMLAEFAWPERTDPYDKLKNVWENK